LTKAIEFYAPGWELFTIWCAVAVPACVVVLWMVRLFGRLGAVISTAVLIAVALVPWTWAHPVRWFYQVAFSAPLIFGALMGLLVWHLWLGRAQKRP
jgi:hypothetical protein